MRGTSREWEVRGRDGGSERDIPSTCQADQLRKREEVAEEEGPYLNIISKRVRRLLELGLRLPQSPHTSVLECKYIDVARSKGEVRERERGSEREGEREGEGL